MKMRKRKFKKQDVGKVVTPGSPWKFDPRRLTLAYGRHYWIDLGQCPTSAAVLDFIMQVAGKTWATEEVLAFLVRDLLHLLHPQYNLCRSGEERGPINVAAIVRQTSQEHPGSRDGCGLPTRVSQLAGLVPDVVIAEGRAEPARGSPVEGKTDSTTP